MTIIACIKGGLGNQMFQYAMGKHLAEKHNTELLLDTMLFQDHEMHNGFELDRVFVQPSRVALKREIKSLLGWKYSKLGMKILNSNRFAFLRGENFFIEDELTFNKAVEALPSDCYLSGYWQSENYFKDIEQIIRHDFVFRQQLNDQSAEIATQILSADSVSLHIRRGDYVTNAESVHSNCTTGYYSKAISYMNEQLANPSYFIFSDDIDWVKKNLKIKAEHCFVNHNSGLDSYNDMHLMSLCKHNIIANSSFSWWGAWLNSNKDKIVVAPKKWFNNDKLIANDIVPSLWVTI